jgi:hypothetical protein
MSNSKQKLLFLFRNRNTSREYSTHPIRKPSYLGVIALTVVFGGAAYVLTSDGPMFKSESEQGYYFFHISILQQPNTLSNLHFFSFSLALDFDVIHHTCTNNTKKNHISENSSKKSSELVLQKHKKH